jgi:hypothetical protein
MLPITGMIEFKDVMQSPEKAAVKSAVPNTVPFFIEGI